VPTIIAIEDDRADRQLLRLAVERARFEVRLSVYATVAEGVAAARFFRPDCLVIDWHMPGGGGREALAQLRQEPATARVPVVVLTGDYDGATIAAAISAGAVDVVAKHTDMGGVAGRLLAACGL
jgi:CheY-like chemotaxis protein